jgi:hypothetical protein
MGAIDAWDDSACCPVDKKRPRAAKAGKRSFFKGKYLDARKMEQMLLHRV